ncbi:hypothetical protein EDI_198220 [Entamoeba dispar SAW760]|uniref:Uncharacterized protein n=1 Tax=Entamoeba dispar (strain ATCC PRA-260 / SAW760) TaxID=370354 RepID=B0EKP4_ENTDS|nr:uncharacterized protein EDI_198220 [Entamoeba dispar SAW760]EDR24901.1 hypothetical protein EDI_198220 [Entamoeba dispar SAW760]|eukprot:EDR24901.1 hypothetical protein EDI_198220 [Entamoeba dispar SAW760]
MIEKIMEDHELRICDLETNLEMVLTKNKTIQEISKVIHVHEIEIDNNALDIEVQRYLIEKIMKKKMDNNTTNEEIVKEMIQEEFKKKYLQKRKDEIEKSKNENINKTKDAPTKQTDYILTKQTSNTIINNLMNNTTVSPDELFNPTTQIKEIEEGLEEK